MLAPPSAAVAAAWRCDWWRRARSPTAPSCRSRDSRFVVGGQAVRLRRAPTSTSCTARDERARAAETIAAARARRADRRAASGRSAKATPPRRLGAQAPAVPRRPRRAGSRRPIGSSIACWPRRARRGLRRHRHARQPLGRLRRHPPVPRAGPACRPNGFGARDRFFADERTRAFYPRAPDAAARAHQHRHRRALRRRSDHLRLGADERVAGGDARRGRRRGARWIEEMARFIKARDPHHLVTPGRDRLHHARRARRVAGASAACRGRLLRQPPLPADHRPRDVAGAARRLHRRSRAARAARRAQADRLRRVRLPHRRARRAGWARRAPPGSQRFLERALLDGAGGALAWIYQPWTGRARDFGIYVDQRRHRRRARGAAHWARAWPRAAPAPHNPLRSATRAATRCSTIPTSPRRARRISTAVDGDAIEIPPERLRRRPLRAARQLGRRAPARTPTARGDGWFEYALLARRRAGDADAGGAALVGVAGHERARRRRLARDRARRRHTRGARSTSSPDDGAGPRRTRCALGRAARRPPHAAPRRRPGAARQRPVRLRRRALPRAHRHGAGEPGPTPS